MGSGYHLFIDFINISPGITVVVKQLPTNQRLMLRVGEFVELEQSALSEVVPPLTVKQVLLSVSLSISRSICLSVCLLVAPFAFICQLFVNHSICQSPGPVYLGALFSVYLQVKFFIIGKICYVLRTLHIS